MKPNNDKIGLLVRKYGSPETTDKFEEELLDLIVKQEEFRTMKENSLRSWPAVTIIATAIMLNVGFLIYLNPFSVNPAFYISTLGFVLGLWALIGIFQRHLTLKIGSV